MTPPRCTSKFNVAVHGTDKVIHFQCDTKVGHSGRHFATKHGYFIRWYTHEEDK